MIGSCCVDVSVFTAALPGRGETVLGHRALIAPAGKGSNQAVAAAACGVPVHFAGRTGADAHGEMIRAGLAERGVQTDALRATSDAQSGLAAVLVGDSGDNAIVVVPGANHCLAPADLAELDTMIGAAALVVLQGEIPLATTYAAIDRCAARAVPVVLNPAPVLGLELARMAGRIAYLVPNETEAAQLWRQPVRSVDDAVRCAIDLQAGGIGCVIVTLGAQGCVVADAGGARHYPGHPVEAVDTTGAGDAFVGSLAASLARGASRDEAVRRALLYSAMSVTASGAQVSYPPAERFEHAWQTQG